MVVKTRYRDIPYGRSLYLRLFLRAGSAESKGTTVSEEKPCQLNKNASTESGRLTG